MTKFYRSEHHGTPIKEFSQLYLLLLSGTGRYPRALHVCAYVDDYHKNLARRRIIGTKDLRLKLPPNCSVSTETAFRGVTPCK